ncbi:hypothetical protein [Streptomyces sp. NPDC018947]|uniref:hypothetical protein n=1 Tax=Streptomyces sp. NPDC018947 TaxID=3365054 RepID=UPI0037A4EE17
MLIAQGTLDETHAAPQDVDIALIDCATHDAIARQPPPRNDTHAMPADDPAMAGPSRYTALLACTPHTTALAQDFVSSVLSVWEIHDADGDCHNNLSALLAQTDHTTHPTVQVSVERQSEGSIRIEITHGPTQMGSAAPCNLGPSPG